MPAIRDLNKRATLRGAYMPATNPQQGDPMNLYGSQVGRIGQMQGEPLPAVGAWSKQSELSRMANSGGSESYFANQALAGAGPQQSAWSLRNPDPYPQGSPARLGSSQERVSPGLRDPLSVALKRSGGGMSLNPDEQKMLGKMDPGALNTLYGGSFAGKQAQAKETVRQRGLASGDSRAMSKTAARDYRRMTLKGMPAPLAGAMTLGGGGGPIDPMMAALSGILPGPTAASFGEIGAKTASDTADRGLKKSLGDQATVAAIMTAPGLTPQDRQSAIQQALGGRGGMAGAGALPGANDNAPLKPGEDPNPGFTEGDGLALENFRGDRSSIENFGKSRKWSSHKIAAAIREYGQTNPLVPDFYDKWAQDAIPQGLEAIKGAFGYGLPAPVGRPASRGGAPTTSPTTSPSWWNRMGNSMTGRGLRRP